MSRKVIACVLAGCLVLVTSCSPAPPPTPDIVRETVEVTRVVEITSTPLPSPTPTELPAVIFEDDFADGPGEWYMGADYTLPATVEEGQLVVTCEKPNWFDSAGHPDLDYLNQPFDLTVTASKLAGVQDAYASVIFRWVDEGNQADISINASGLLSHGLWIDEQYYSVIPWTRIKGADPETNTFRLVDDGTRVKAYINGELAFDVPLTDPGLGGVGFGVGTFQKGGASWAFSDLVIRHVK